MNNLYNNGTKIGVVLSPVNIDETMTQSVGMDNDGKLFTTPFEQSSQDATNNLNNIKILESIEKIDSSKISSTTTFDKATNILTTIEEEEGKQIITKQTLDGEIYQYIRFPNKYFKNTTSMGDSNDYDIIVFLTSHINLIHCTDATIKASTITLENNIITRINYASVNVEHYVLSTGLGQVQKAYEVPIGTFPFEIITIKKEPIVEPKFYEPLKFKKISFPFNYSINEGIISFKGNGTSNQLNIIRLLEGEYFIKYPIAVGKQLVYIDKNGVANSIGNANEANIKALDWTNIEYFFIGGYIDPVENLTMATNLRNGGDYELLPEYKTSQNYFKDMVFSFVGDSVTEGVYSGADAIISGINYPDVVASLIHPKAYYNLGHQGTSISGDGSVDGYTAFWTDSRINEIPEDTDIIFIMGGLNDSGTITDADMTYSNHNTNNIIGALNVVISKIYYRFTQLSSNDSSFISYYEDIDYSGVNQITTPKKIQIVLLLHTRWFASVDRMFNNAEYQKKWARMWSIPCIEVGDKTGFNTFSTTSGLHFKGAEYYHMGVIIAAELAKYNLLPVFDGWK